jgi:hypothetical protein
MIWVGQTSPQCGDSHNADSAAARPAGPGNCEGCRELEWGRTAMFPARWLSSVRPIFEFVIQCSLVKTSCPLSTMIL